MKGFKNCLAAALRWVIILVFAGGLLMLPANNASAANRYWLVVATSASASPTESKPAYLAKSNVTLTLYVHEGTTSGPVIVGAQVSGQDAAGSSFSQVTNFTPLYSFVDFVGKGFKAFAAMCHRLFIDFEALKADDRIVIGMSLC
jgi:hypothetical protein